MYKHNDVIATGTGRQFCTLGRISSSTTVGMKTFPDSAQGNRVECPVHEASTIHDHTKSKLPLKEI